MACTGSPSTNVCYITRLYSALMMVDTRTSQLTLRLDRTLPGSMHPFATGEGGLIGVDRVGVDRDRQRVQRCMSRTAGTPLDVFCLAIIRPTEDG